MVSWNLNTLLFRGDYTPLHHPLTFGEPGSLWVYEVLANWFGVCSMTRDSTGYLGYGIAVSLETLQDQLTWRSLENHCFAIGDRSSLMVGIFHSHSLFFRWCKFSVAGCQSLVFRVFFVVRHWQSLCSR